MFVLSSQRSPCGVGQGGRYLHTTIALAFRGNRPNNKQLESVNTEDDPRTYLTANDPFNQTETMPLGRCCDWSIVIYRVMAMVR